jgi:hypothetical protein
MSGSAGSGHSAAAGAALVIAQSGMSAPAGRRSCPDGEIDAMGPTGDLGTERGVQRRVQRGFLATRNALGSSDQRGDHQCGGGIS